MNTLTQTHSHRHSYKHPSLLLSSHTSNTRARDNVGTSSVAPGEATRATTSVAAATNRGRDSTPNPNNNKFPATGHHHMASPTEHFSLRRRSAPSSTATIAPHSPVLVPNSQPESS